MSDERLASAAERLAAWMAVHLGWSPDQFWSATPREVAGIVALILPDAAEAVVDRRTLDTMMEAFPDG